MNRDLTQGPVTKSMLLFALPMILGNLLQQFYNVADTLIVGQFLGSTALAAVGSSYTLMTFLTSILLGMCMGSGAVFSIRFGEGDLPRLKNSLSLSFLLIGGFTVALNVAVFLLIDPMMALLQVPADVIPLMRSYLWVIFWGIGGTFLYNYFASLLRAVGNSATPLVFLGVSAVLNIVLDLVFVVAVPWGVAGAAFATSFSQWVSGVGLLVYTWKRMAHLRPSRQDVYWKKDRVGEIARFSLLTCVQQSVMNFGILMIQGLVNSFGEIVMAAFAAAVKIESFAYMPAQDFSNAFSTFVAQNFGARQPERIRAGIRRSFALVLGFCAVVSAAVLLFASPLMRLFIPAADTEVIREGVYYLRCVAPFYFGIGFLFLFYALYRAVKKPAMSVVLTVVSLGTRVALAYLTAGTLGVAGIWAAIPIGWVLADITGAVYYFRKRKALLPETVQ